MRMLTPIYHGRPGIQLTTHPPEQYTQTQVQNQEEVLAFHVQ